MTTLMHLLFLTQRQLRALLRQPWYIAFTIVQPVIWLVLYGQLFQRVVELPGFHGESYISFLTPGVIIMTALFSGGWNGMGTIVEIERGVMDRFLVSPASRVALIGGRLAALAVVSIVQSVLLIALGLLLGARLGGGALGVATLLAGGVLLAVPFGALSNALALTVRKQESVIGASNFLLLPLTFLSPVYMAKDLMPGWIRTVTRFNPVTWSVDAAREALKPQADWAAVLARIACLVLFALASAALATRAFRTYQRSL
jgi:ABC-2 type transport system permease protein